MSWIFLDKIIVWTPSIPHFKGLGLRNLQYGLRIFQKSHNYNVKLLHNFILKFKISGQILLHWATLKGVTEFQNEKKIRPLLTVIYKSKMSVPQNLK